MNNKIKAENYFEPGRYAAKRSSRDELLNLMRKIILDNANYNQHQAVAAWIRKLEEVNKLTVGMNIIHEALEYAGNNIWLRCTRQQTAKSTSTTITPELVAKARKIVESEIRLWNMKIPTTNKTLPNCTFGELAQAAPLTGRFLAKLSQQGAPGTLVKEVFKTEKDLQVFWKASQ